MQMWSAVRCDVEAHLGHPPGLGELLATLLGSRGVQVLLLYRLGRWLRARAVPGASVLARISQFLFTVDIDPGAEIAPGVVLRHPMCVVIGRGVVIEPEVVLFHGVTLGNRMSGDLDRPDGPPTVRRGVRVGAGAKILGPIEVGAGTHVGANAVVTRHVPAAAHVVGANRVLEGRGRRIAETGSWR